MFLVLGEKHRSSRLSMMLAVDFLFIMSFTRLHNSNFKDKFNKAREVEALAPNRTANTQDKNLDFHQPRPSSATTTVAAQHVPGPVVWGWK